MKEFDIRGTLSTNEDQTHHEMLGKLFEILKAAGFHFSGVTKEVNDEIHIHNK